MIGHLEQARHATERGRILMTLQQDYASGVFVFVKSLMGAMDQQGISLTVDGMAFHLRYLVDQGYIATRTAGEMPGFRRDRATVERAETIVAVKLTVKGLHLIDGQVAEDPAVKF